MASPVTPSGKSGSYTWVLVLGALGVVYGDIGTSPLYAFRECFHPSHGIKPTEGNVLGILSLIVWSLILIVAVKYLSFVLRADNRGEGGVLALFALAFPERDRSQPWNRRILIAMGIFGAALLYGDGMLTPAVTILGAVEGLNVVTKSFERFVMPITVGVVVLLFSFQRLGTAKVGRVFGPITLLWFIAISILGILEVARGPSVLRSINPYYALMFFVENGYRAFVVLGSVVLVVTGGEALYADMGHFGRSPIRRAWFVVVLPALLLNYFGQGALVLKDPSAVANPFYRLAPVWALMPLVVLATMAAVIASQALISGAFSITMQAIQLGYSPRMQIDHTSSEERGQIYMPLVNWTLMICCIGLVVEFKTSSNLAAAYGVAVTFTMLITTLLFYVAARRLWNWNPIILGFVCGIFVIIEMAFLGANLLKIPHGGWFPLTVALVIFVCMTTWRRGRQLLGDRLRAGTLPLSMFLEDVAQNPPLRVAGTAVFLSGNAEGTPMALLHNLKHNKVLHERVIILTVRTVEVPHVSPAERLEVAELGHDFYKVIGQYGFMEDPNVPALLARCHEHGLTYEPLKTTYFVSRETLIPTSKPGMPIWRESIFVYLSRNAQTATAFFRLPANRVVELGVQVEI